MSKEEIVIQLKNSHAAFVNFIQSLDEKSFLFTVPDKWTPGQHADHIFRSIKPLKLAYSSPKFLLKIIIGEANRPSRTYEALIEKYKNKLESGGKAAGFVLPADVKFEEKEKICDRIILVTDVICNKVKHFSEEDLDKYILPHPLLGKLTLREMLYFTIYHAEHHLNSVKNLLSTNATK